MEDDANDVALIRRALAKAGVSNPLHLAEDGEDALSYFRCEGRFAGRGQQESPGLVLLDLKLPRKSGFEVLEWLKSDPRWRRLPVVVLTSSNHSSDVGKAYDLGANSYLQKPVTFASLVAMVRGLDLYWIRLNQSPEIRSA